jgi:hypothetical protein
MALKLRQKSTVCYFLLEVTNSHISQLFWVVVSFGLNCQLVGKFYQVISQYRAVLSFYFFEISLDDNF